MSRVLNFPVFDSEVLEISDAAATLTLEQNKMYFLTSQSLSSIVIQGVSAGFKYCGLSFDSPADAAPTFGVPSTGFYFTGKDCSSGVFTPQTGVRYHLAVEYIIDHIVVWVAKEE